MENRRYSYWPMPERLPIRWPNDGWVAFLALPNIEHFPWDKPRSGGGPGPFPDVQSFAVRDYGNRLGVWRLADTLAKHGVRATVALNSDVCKYEPQIIKMGMERGWEWMGHGRTNAERLQGLDEDAERALIADVVQTIIKATGAPPRGWLSPGRVQSERTPDLLAEAGFTYLADWSADDQPFPFHVRRGRLVCVQGAQVSDTSAFLNAQWPAHEFTTMLCEHFDQLYEEGRESGRVMSINLHPWLVGHPWRIKALDKALEYITGHDHVWLATGSEVADYYYGNYYDEALRRVPFPPLPDQP